MIKKIDIPDDLQSHMNGAYFREYNLWQTLVEAIEANNKEIENITKVYAITISEDISIYDAVKFDLRQREGHTKYAYITKPQPIKKKTKEERAMEFVERLANYDGNEAWAREAREILEESEET